MRWMGEVKPGVPTYIGGYTYENLIVQHIELRPGRLLNLRNFLFIFLPNFQPQSGQKMIAADFL